MRSNSEQNGRRLRRVSTTSRNASGSLCARRCLSDRIGPKIDVGSCREATGGRREGFRGQLCPSAERVCLGRQREGNGVGRTPEHGPHAAFRPLPPSVRKRKALGAGLGSPSRATSDEGLRDVPFRAHMCLPNFLMMGGNSYRP